MEKLDKKKVLAVVLIIALIAALAGTVSLLYNSIDMFVHSVLDSFSNNRGRSEDYIRWQEPYAIILLFAFVAAGVGTGAGIASFIVKKESAKKACLILALCAAGALLVLTVAAVGVNFANEAYRAKKWNYGSLKYPTGTTEYYAIFAGAMAVLLPPLVYCAIIAAVLLTVYLIDKKAAKTTAVETNDINSENKGE